MDAERYIKEKERLSQALNGEDQLNSAVTDIIAVLRDYNLDSMPETAFDVFCYALGTVHLAKLDLSGYTP